MLYTRAGDKGTTKVFTSKSGQRISKSSCQTEALGSLDELNSFLGLLKIKSVGFPWSLDGKAIENIVGWSQNALFTVQAEVAGSPMTIKEEQVKYVEHIVDSVEKELPTIKTFFISGGTELASLADFARTLARRAEREVIRSIEKGEVKVGEHTLSLLNRFSSLFYALARLINHKSGIKEEPPTY